MNVRPLLLLLTLSCSAQAEPQAQATPAAQSSPQVQDSLLAQARELVRQGRAPEALKLLPAEPQEPEALFWRGRALLDVGRLGEAALAFSRVPAEHRLHPYAARGLLYCAWQGENLNFIETVAPLTACQEPEIAGLALAALAEYQLKNTRNGDLASLEELKELIENYPECRPLLRLLEMEALRRKGDFDGALAHARKLESDKTLSLLMRQRVRLALSEVYYAREAALANQPLTSEDDTDEEGKGEETLLQFISANPDSPLLEEAFRRLNIHGAFRSSEYAKDKLREWGADSAQPRRATLALLALQQLSLANNDPGDDATCANTAASSFPKEEATRLLLQEQARHLLTLRKNDEALFYLNMLQDRADARSLFYEATARQQDPAAARKLFLLCADKAPASLRRAALVNALICAVREGNPAEAERLLHLDVMPSTRRELLLAHAGMILHTNPSQAQAELQELLKQEPTESQKADALMDLEEISLLQAPTGTDQNLAESLPEPKENWSDRQELRYHALQVRAQEQTKGQQILSGQAQAEREQAVQARADTDAPGAEEATLSALRHALLSTTRPSVRQTLTEHLVAALSAAGKHAEALQYLEELTEGMPSGEEKARLTIRAGREAEKLGSLESLNKAISLYSACAQMETALSARAQILKAALLSRLNRGEEARGLLQNTLKNQATLSAHDLALAYSTLSDSWFMEGSEQGKQLALDACQQIFDIPDLPQEWYTRATQQRASLYARFGHHTEALEDYLHILRQRPASGTNPTRAEWVILYYSAAGAIYQHTQLKQYAEAAQLAETIARWPHEREEQEQPKTCPEGPRAKLFADWAARIRQTHFLPASHPSGTSLFPREGQRNSHQTAR